MFKVPWPQQGTLYNAEDKEAVLEVMRGKKQTQGEYLGRFEDAFSQYHGGRFCYAVSSGAAALEIAAMLMDFKEGDEVIIPAHTYTATALPFARRGVKIRWADIRPGYRTVFAENIEPLITEQTKAVVVVHLYGTTAPMACIMALSRKFGFKVIEDCAQSLGAQYQYRHGWNGPITPWGRSGTHGDIACYSFHSQKNITTLGEGGMITTKHIGYAKLIPGLRHNGHRRNGDQKVTDFDMGGVYPYNFSIGEAQCAVGISQLNRLDTLNNDRYNKARMIVDGLEDIEDLVFQKIPKGGSHTYHLLCAKYRERDKLIDILANKYGIECVIQYKPLYGYPLFKNYEEHNCPNSDEFHDNALSFPFAGWFSEETVLYIRDSIRKAIEEI